jgi:hypothetical protein
MTTTLTAAYDPKVSEFVSAEHADSYTTWLRQEIETRRNDGAIGVPHAQVMQRMGAVLNRFPVQQAA